MDHYRLKNYRMEWNDRSGDLLLLVDGSIRYKKILSRAFSNLYFSRTFDDRNENFDWGTYIKYASEKDAEDLHKLCHLLKQNIFIDDDLTECFALDYHSQLSHDGRWKRTQLGEIVRDAKPYDRGFNSGSKSSAERIVRWINEFFLPYHPTYLFADLIVSVPPSNPNKFFDLPEYIARRISESWSGFEFCSSAIKKIRATRPMKECKTIEEKIDNIKDAFQVDSNVFRNQSVLIIDDIYQTGFSLNELARTLFLAGAKLVLGLVATKTLKDLSEVSS